MKKYPIHLQDEENACGAYCISMILQYYGFHENIYEIKKHGRMNKKGMTLKSIIECLKWYQIEANAYECTLDVLDKQQFPCILFTVEEELGHFVVLYEKKNDEYKVGDPARGLVVYQREELLEKYAHRVVIVKHVGRVPQLQWTSYREYLLEMGKMYKPEFITMVKRGLYISLLGYLSGYFFQIVIDGFHIKTHYFYMVMVCIVYTCVELIKNWILHMKKQDMIRLEKALNEECVFDVSMSMLEKPILFFQQDEGYIQSQILSFYDLSAVSIQYYEQLIVDGLSFLVFCIGMCWIGLPLFGLTIFMFISIGLCMNYYIERIQKLYKQEMECSFHYQHHLLELIQSSFFIQTYDLLQEIKEKSFHCFMDEEDAKEKFLVMNDNMHFYLKVIIFSFMGIILSLGFYLYTLEMMTKGNIVMFYMLLSYCIEPVSHFVMMLNQYKQMDIIYEKYRNFEKEEKDKKQIFNEKITRIVCDDVSYAYGYEKPVLEHVDCIIDHHLMMKGKIGSGKSTLLKLFMGYDLNYTGNIYINDHELRTLDLPSLYKHLGYVDASPCFLHDTLENNFLSHDNEKIDYYLKIFEQEELLDMMHYELGVDGHPLSMGQKQVVALVRALLQDYDVLILDEAYSHMDKNLSKRVMKYLADNEENKIFIVVNHQIKIVNKSFDYAIIEGGKLYRRG